jgi:hypothetical protein
MPLISKKQLDTQYCLIFRAPMIHWERNPGRRCGALPLRSALG